VLPRLIEVDNLETAALESAANKQREVSNGDERLFVRAPAAKHVRSRNFKPGAIVRVMVSGSIHTFGGRGSPPVNRHHISALKRAWT
jgi:hypothetical protein